jgi:streptogramin lyase/mono/diheme cytochrome c family protein
MTLTKTLALGTAAGIAMLCSGSAFALDNAGSLTGVVNGANGQPVAGAFVRLKNADKRLTFLVVSQGNGTFTASDLPAGSYTVQGIGTTMQSAISAPVAVSENQTARTNVALNQNRGPMLAPAWPGRVPEAQLASVPKDAAALPAGEGKALVAEKCTVCHDVQRIMAKRSNTDDWAFTVKRMEGMAGGAISDADAAAIVKYVTASFQAPGGTDPNSRLPNYAMGGLSQKYRVVTIDLPRRYSEPHDIASDPKGVAWAAERAGALIRFDPKTYDFTEVKIPAGPAPADRQRLGNPQINDKGILWTADGPNNRWLSYDTNAFNRENPGVAFHIYPWTAKGHGGAGGNSFTLHPDGTIWGTGQGREVRVLNPATAEFSFYEAPSYAQTKESPGAYGLAVAGDGSVWWAEDEADMMARVDPKTGKVEEFKLPDVGGHALPRRMNTDWDGNLWVGIWEAGKLMKIDYKTKQMTMYTPKTPSLGMYTVVADKKNKYIWVAAQQVDKMFRFNPATEEFVEFPLAYSQQDSRRIDIDPTNPNRIFFSGNTADRIGFVELLP